MVGPDPLSIARQQLSNAISNFQTPTCEAECQEPTSVGLWEPQL